MHLAGGNATFTTKLGAIGDEVSITVEDVILLEEDYVIHFPVSMRNVWDNVIYTCSVQLLFRNEAEVGVWCSTRGIPKGDVKPINLIWDFAAEWYGTHADVNWKKWSLQDAIDIFRRHGLTGSTWSLGGHGDRFQRYLKIHIVRTLDIQLHMFTDQTCEMYISLVAGDHD